MDNETLTRWKLLANDAVIATFGQLTREQQLAEALERAVDELTEVSNTCRVCSYCDNHGNNEADIMDTGDEIVIRPVWEPDKE